jgi:hypothetical protein
MGRSPLLRALLTLVVAVTLPAPGTGGAGRSRRSAACVDANRTGVQELTQSGKAGVTVFHDGDADGRPDLGGIRAVTGQDSRAFLQALPAGPQGLCVVPPAGWAVSMPRCQTVAVGGAEAVGGFVTNRGASQGRLGARTRLTTPNHTKPAENAWIVAGCPAWWPGVPGC